MTVTDPDPGAHNTAADTSFEPLISASVSDRCSHCGSEMAPDQRYCVECGARRGRARFKLPATTSAVVAPLVSGPREVVAAPAPVRTISSSAALLGTIALLLLAMGVGVLIGNSGHSTPASKVTVIGGGGGGTAATAGTAGSGAGGAAASSGSTPKVSASTGSRHAHARSSSSSSSASSGSTLHPSVPNVTSLHTKAQRKKAEATIIKKTVPLKNGKKLAPETQKLGGSCSAGTVGCVNGKYTGQFF